MAEVLVVVAAPMSSYSVANATYEAQSVNPMFLGGCSDTKLVETQLPSRAQLLELLLKLIVLNG